MPGRLDGKVLGRPRTCFDHAPRAPRHPHHAPAPTLQPRPNHTLPHLKVCVITGGTSGIGRETVFLFVQEGAKVVFCGRGVEAGEAIAAEAGNNCVFVRADVTIEAEIENVVNTAVAKWGKLDWCVPELGGAWCGGERVRHCPPPLPPHPHARARWCRQHIQQRRRRHGPARRRHEGDGQGDPARVFAQL